MAMTVEFENYFDIQKTLDKADANGLRISFDHYNGKWKATVKAIGGDLEEKLLAEGTTFEQLKWFVDGAVFGMDVWKRMHR